MTQVITKNIKCNCGNDVEIVVYDSVNVTLDPKLKEAVVNRKINSFKCSKCGLKAEISYKFLYHDMDNKKMIWCYPKYEKDNAENIKKMLIETAKNVAEAAGVKKYQEPNLVFGYDELLKLI
jgi:S-methylmethionine-dependent homocysteine/selenocysteine methylase